MCVCSDRQHAKHMSRIIFSSVASLAVQYFFSHYLINGTFFRGVGGGGDLLNIQHVLWFSLQISWLTPSDIFRKHTVWIEEKLSTTLKTAYTGSYVYWTVHHLDSWVKRDQLDVTCFIVSLFNAQHVSDVNTSILRSLRLMCWVISWIVLIWFDVCWCYVVVWPWWCGIRRQAEALQVFQPAYGYHTTTAIPQHNTNTHRTRSIQPMK